MNIVYEQMRIFSLYGREYANQRKKATCGWNFWGYRSYVAGRVLNVIKLSNSNPSTPPLWLLIYGIGIMIFSLLLFSLRAGIRIFLIFMVIGAALALLWLFLYIRARQRSRAGVIAQQPCICPICNHEETGSCIQQKCACCIVMKGETVIGHNNNPLQ